MCDAFCCWWFWIPGVSRAKSCWPSPRVQSHNHSIIVFPRTCLSSTSLSITSPHNQNLSQLLSASISPLPVVCVTVGRQLCTIIHNSQLTIWRAMKWLWSRPGAAVEEATTKHLQQLLALLQTLHILSQLNSILSETKNELQRSFLLIAGFPNPFLSFRSHWMRRTLLICPLALQNRRGEYWCNFVLAWFLSQQFIRDAVVCPICVRPCQQIWSRAVQASAASLLPN